MEIEKEVGKIDTFIIDKFIGEDNKWNGLITSVNKGNLQYFNSEDELTDIFERYCA